MCAIEDYRTADLEFRLQIARVNMNEDKICLQYLIENYKRLIPEIINAANSQNIDVDTLVASFIRGVHKRHEAGFLTN